MRTRNNKVSKVVSSVNRRKLVNNVQKVFLSLINANNDGWVPRTALRVPSATARIRDLRKSKFGGFRVECATATELGKVSRSVKTKRQTFYRLVPSSVTEDRVTKVLKGVM